MSFTGSFVSYDETLGSGSFIVEGVDFYASQSAKIQNVLGTNPALEVTGSVIATGGIQAAGGFTGSFSGSFVGFIDSASLAQTASYVNIVAGPNITVNFENGGISVSGSATTINTSSFVTTASFNSYTSSQALTSSIQYINLGGGIAPTVKNYTLYFTVTTGTPTVVFSPPANEPAVFVEYYASSFNYGGDFLRAGTVTMTNDYVGTSAILDTTTANLGTGNVTFTSDNQGRLIATKTTVQDLDIAMNIRALL